MKRKRSKRTLEERERERAVRDALLDRIQVARQDAEDVRAAHEGREPARVPRGLPPFAETRKLLRMRIEHGRALNEP